MKKTMELYFKNEDDVASAHASLNTLKVNNITIEEIPGDVDTSLFIPFISANLGSPNIYGGSSFGTSGGVFSMIANDEKDQRRFSHLLRVEVAEEDYERFLQAVRKHDCYVRK